MPSKAHASFVENCHDVDRLLEIHTDITGDKQGRRWKVEALHKSAIVLLTAFWEAFCEDLAAEGLRHLVEKSPEASMLPEPLRKLIAAELKSSKHELAVWEVADNGWRTVLSSRMERLQEERNRKLNTPKTNQINELFHMTVGVKDISKRWYWKGMKAQRAADKLDEFVTLRGAVAHRGSAANSITKVQVNDFYGHIWKLTKLTESAISRPITESTGMAPWPEEEA